jgi:hypothetical protein
MSSLIVAVSGAAAGTGSFLSLVEGLIDRSTEKDELKSIYLRQIIRLLRSE